MVWIRHASSLPYGKGGGFNRSAHSARPRRVKRKREEGRGEREEGRAKREEGRGKLAVGRRKREGGRQKREERKEE